MRRRNTRGWSRSEESGQPEGHEVIGLEPGEWVLGRDIKEESALELDLPARAQPSLRLDEDGGRTVFAIEHHAGEDRGVLEIVQCKAGAEEDVVVEDGGWCEPGVRVPAVVENLGEKAQIGSGSADLVERVLDTAHQSAEVRAMPGASDALELPQPRPPGVLEIDTELTDLVVVGDQPIPRGGGEEARLAAGSFEV